MIGPIVASVIVLGTLYFIISEKIDKVIAVAVGAILMSIAGHFLGFYSQSKALMAIDFNTLGLLLGMMIIVAMLKKTGFFTYIAIALAKLSRGKPWILMAILGISTAFISMLVDNVTTIIVIGPISILVCDILGLSPLPILMVEILLSNIGGVGTMIGDPPNVLIASASGLNFDDFLGHLFPVTVMIILVSLPILIFIHRKSLSGKTRNFQAILKIDPRGAIKNPKAMLKALSALLITFVLFFFHDIHGLYPSFIALFGAGLALLLLRPNPEEILHDIEWPVLAFFTCFFVIVGGIEETGVLSLLALKTSALAKFDIRLYKILLLWFAGILSSLIDNVPFTMIMIPVVKSLAVAGIEIGPIWWILAMGVGFGSNALPIGSSAGILGLAISKRSRTPIDTKTWFYSGTVVSVVSLACVTVLILLGFF